jgi:aminoglycoside phosphotransferase
MATLLWIVGVGLVIVLFQGWIRFKGVIDCVGIGLAKDYEENKKKALIEGFKCESDETGWCEVCAVVYEVDEGDDPCPFH